MNVHVTWRGDRLPGAADGCVSARMISVLFLET